MCSNFSCNCYFRDPPERSCLNGVYYTGISVSIWVVMVLMVSPCLSAPRSSPWWTDACNSSPAYNVCMNSGIPSLSLRHGRSPVEVRDQLAVLLNSLRWHRKQLMKFYTNTTHGNILPNAKLTDPNLSKVVEQMRKKKKNKIIKFYVGLQMTARVLDRYVGFNIDSMALPQKYSEKRRCILTEILYSVKSLLCEVRDTIIDEVPRGRNQVERHALKRVGNKRNQPDLSEIFMQDITLLKKMKWFLRTSKKILFRSKKRRTLRL